MDRITLDRLIDEGELVEAEASVKGFEILFDAANQLGWEKIDA